MQWIIGYDKVAFIKRDTDKSRRYSMATAFDEIAITRSEDGKDLYSCC
jgi:hypothetical protein